MSTNKFFSISRFVKLLRNDFQINNKGYLFAIIGVSIGLFVFLLKAMTISNDNFIQKDYVSFLGFGLLFVGLNLSASFPAFNIKNMAADYLLLPASTFEKMLSQIIIRFLASMVLLIFILWVESHLASWAALQLKSVKEKGILIESFQLSTLINFKNVSLSDKFVFSMGYISVCSFLFASRLFFKKFSLAKTFLSYAVIGFIYSCIMALLSHAYYPETKGFNVLLSTFEIFPGINNKQMFLYILLSISWLFFLPLGYHKLKEKQE